jgi:hypothetical protein
VRWTLLSILLLALIAGASRARHLVAFSAHPHVHEEPGHSHSHGHWHGDVYHDHGHHHHDEPAESLEEHQDESHDHHGWTNDPSPTESESHGLIFVVTRGSQSRTPLFVVALVVLNQRFPCDAYRNPELPPPRARNGPVLCRHPIELLRTVVLQV